MYITGDTLVIDDLWDIPRRYPEIDLALLHLGGTRILGILLTMDAEQGVEVLQVIKPKRAIPIHHNDYESSSRPCPISSGRLKRQDWRIGSTT
jgi:L-ascorbate metabolism protein UlaG (beta-lactamase superfamily)